MWKTLPALMASILITVAQLDLNWYPLPPSTDPVTRQSDQIETNRIQLEQQRRQLQDQQRVLDQLRIEQQQQFGLPGRGLQPR